MTDPGKRAGMDSAAAIRTTVIAMAIAALTGICGVLIVVGWTPHRQVREVREMTAKEVARYKNKHFVKIVAPPPQGSIMRRRRAFDPMFESIAPDGEDNLRRALRFSPSTLGSWTAAKSR